MELLDGLEPDGEASTREACAEEGTVLDTAVRAARGTKRARFWGGLESEPCPDAFPATAAAAAAACLVPREEDALEEDEEDDIVVFWNFEL